jgi:tetratricopeptide (TPR) repeat protein
VTAHIPEQRTTDPGQVWLLRSRGCWQAAAALLDGHAGSAVERAELLIEAAFFTGRGWEDAETALRAAEAVVRDNRERAAAACARGFLAYGATVLKVHDRLDEAQAALGRASALLAPEDPARPLLDFRRGLIAQALLGDAVAARASYRRAHAGAEQQQDAHLLSYTWRHLAAIAQEDGNVAGARHGYAESLRLREETGFAIGLAPALAALADVSPPAEAAQLRSEARRLVSAFAGTPVWLTLD